MVQSHAEYVSLTFQEPAAAAFTLAPFTTPAAEAHYVSYPPDTLRSDFIAIGADEAVRVEHDQIVAVPTKMIRGLGYPVIFKGSHWWVENVDGDTIRYYRGPKAV